ncbi:sugar hydrolase, partial [Streptomyces sp. SAS_269]
MAAAAALVGGVLALGTPDRAGAAVADTIPLKITNNSGRSEPVYVYDLGTQLSSGRQGWADESGAF